MHASVYSVTADNGILTVALPKTETAKPRRIEIRSPGRGRLGSK